MGFFYKPLFLYAQPATSRSGKGPGEISGNTGKILAQTPKAGLDSLI
jgi:hypothetical protein